MNRQENDSWRVEFQTLLSEPDIAQSDTYTCMERNNGTEYLKWKLSSKIREV